MSEGGLSSFIYLYIYSSLPLTSENDRERGESPRAHEEEMHYERVYTIHFFNLIQFHVCEFAGCKYFVLRDLSLYRFFRDV